VRVLIGCESSGIVREAFRRRGHDAWSCDTQAADDQSPYHYQCDVRDVLGLPWDIGIFHPPCTYVSGSGWHWVTRGRIEADGRPRIDHVNDAVAFARMFIDGPETKHIPGRVVENPIGRLSTLIRAPDQIIQPYDFGEDASKATCLWLYGLPRLRPTRRVAGRWCLQKNGKMVERWSNQTDSGQNKLTPSDDRWKLRSATYPGIADAFADQYGSGQLVAAPLIHVQSSLFG
jgi:hypothetical protein